MGLHCVWRSSRPVRACRSQDSAAGDGSEDDEGLGAGDDGGRKRRVGGIVGEILLAGEEAQEVTALVGDVVADGSSEHGVTGLQHVKDGGDGDGCGNYESDLDAGSGERAEVLGEFNADM